MPKSQRYGMQRSSAMAAAHIKIVFALPPALLPPALLPLASLTITILQCDAHVCVASKQVRPHSETLPLWKAPQGDISEKVVAKL